MTVGPFKARLIVAYTGALLVVLTAFCAAVLWQQERIGLRRVDRELIGLSGTLANVLRDELSEKGEPSKAAQEARDLVTAAGRAIAILDVRGSVLAARWNGLELPSGAATGGSQATTIETPAGACRVRVTPQPFGTP